MRLLSIFSVGLFLTTLLSACATPSGGPDMMWKSQVGQYGENVRIFNEEIKSFAKADDMQIFAVCEALLETRDYGRLFACLDNMDARIAQDNFSVMMMSVEGLDLMSKVTRARGLLDLGEIEKARAVAESSVMPDGFVSRGYYWIHHYGIRSLT